MRILALAALAALFLAAPAYSADEAKAAPPARGAASAVASSASAASAPAASAPAAPAVETPSPAVENEMRGFFPKPQEIAGWAFSADITFYPGQKIYDFIDGAGEVYMKYNFETVAAAEYTGPNDGTIDVEIYRMKTVEDAYGIYSYTRFSGSSTTKSEAIDLPRAAYISGLVGGLWKDVYCVKVYALEDKPGVAAAVKDFLAFVSKKIPRAPGLPDVFRVVEVEGYVKGTTRFVRCDLALKNLHFVSEDNVLGLSEGTLMVIGDFKFRTASFTGFTVIYPTEDAAKAAATGFAKFLGSDKSREATWFKRSGRAIAGVWTGLKPSETQDSQDVMYSTIQMMIDQVKTYQLN